MIATKMGRWASVAVILIAVCLMTWGQAAEPFKIQIVQPTEGQTLRGTVEVRVVATPADRVPTAAYATVGGTPWVELHRLEGTHEWVGELDTTLAPTGEVQVVTRAFSGGDKPQAVVKVVLANDLRCYFGDLHSHTCYSDGTLFPKDAYAYARDVAKLDFFSLTDHLELLDAAEWADSREQAWKANADRTFVAFPGLEWTKKVGHANIFDPPSTQWPTDAAGLYQALADAGCIGKFNHPGTGTEVFDGLAYSQVGDSAMELMEVRDEEEQQAYIRALNLGWHIAPDGSDDTHSANWGLKGPWTAILAPGLSRINAWTALKSRHCYSTGDRNCRLFFRVNDAVMGDIIGEPVAKVAILVDVADPDAGDAIASIELFADGTVIQTDEPNAPTRRWELTLSPTPGPHYYFVKITQADGDKMWSAPVWVTVAPG